MSAKGWQEGNGGNTLLYASNVRARTRAHARVTADDPTVTTVASVANIDEWLATRHFETVAQTVAKHRTVATAMNRSQAPLQFPWTISGLLADVMGFQKKAAAERSPRHQLQCLHQEIHSLREMLADLFAQQNGWCHSLSFFTPSMLARSAVRYSPWRSGSDWSGNFVDHSYYFRTPSRNAAAFATNPYGLHWTVDHPDIRAFCERNGLHANIPDDFPSWWYPRRTTLIVFTPATSAIQEFNA